MGNSTIDENASAFFGIIDLTAPDRPMPALPRGVSEQRALASLVTRSQVGADENTISAGIRPLRGPRPAAALKAGQGLRFTGQSLQATIPPPKAPRVTCDASVQQAFQSFAGEGQAVLQRAGAWVAGQPLLQKSPGATLMQQSSTAGGAANNAAHWVANAGMGMQALANGSLAAFMKLRIETSDNALNAMQDLASSTADLQSTMALEMADAANAAQLEAAKVRKKTALINLFSHIASLVIAVITTVVTIASFDPEIAAAAIVMAAVVSLVAGAIKGKGHGFDVWTAVDWFSNGLCFADAMGSVYEAVAEVAMKAAVKVAVEVAVNAAESAAKAAASRAAGEQMQNLLESLRSQMRKAGSATDEGTTAAAQAADTAPDKTLTEEQIAEEQERLLRKGYDRLYADAKGNIATRLPMDTDEVAETVGKLFEMGTSARVGAAVVGVAGATNGTSHGVFNLQVSLDQASADEDMAHFKQLQAVIKLLDSTYKTANDLVQTLTKSHSNAVDTVQAILKNNNDVQNMVATNMSQA